MPDETEKLILEMGMDHAQEISFLSNLAQPEVAAITMIGEAPCGKFRLTSRHCTSKNGNRRWLKPEDGSLFVPSA
jgi:UDP-N-acetylmuramoyl-tripeptide--D-alanyl-D-alanine ligase